MVRAFGVKKLKTNKIKQHKKTRDFCVYKATGGLKNYLDELIEGNGIISICVCFLYGPVSDAAELFIWNVDANHHP